MEQTEVKIEPTDQAGNLNNAMAVTQSPENHASSQISPQGGTTSINAASEKSSCSAGVTTYTYVYALGRIMARFPTMGVEKEFVQATGRTGNETAGLTNQKTFHSIMSKPENRYLVRKMCWVLAIEGIDTYILQPRDPADFDSLVEAIRPAPNSIDLDAVIGVKGIIAPPEMCNGLMVPIVGFDLIYSFNCDSFLETLKEKRPESISEEEFKAAAQEVFYRIMKMADNAGATDEHRALNYLSLRYDAIYAKTAEMHGRNYSLTAVEVRPSPLSDVRKIVDVIFSYTHRETDFIEMFFVRVDVTEEFPFMVTKLSPYCYVQF